MKKPTIEINIPDEYLKSDSDPKELVTILECLLYINGISHCLLLIGAEGGLVSAGARYDHAIGFLGEMNERFCSIAHNNLDEYILSIYPREKRGENR